MHRNVNFNLDGREAFFLLQDRVSRKLGPQKLGAQTPNWTQYPRVYPKLNTPRGMENSHSADVSKTQTLSFYLIFMISWF